MRRLLPSGFAGVLAAAIAVAISGSALAFFSSEGVGEASAGVTKLSVPKITAVTPAAGGTVTLTWGAVTAPGTGTVTYYVTREDGTPAGTCPNASTPAAVLTCKDSGLAVGTHEYTVTAIWRSWSAVSTVSTGKVTVGAATHFTIAAASLTPGVSVADNLTITAKDENEATVTTYTGSHSLVFAGAAASPGGTKATVANSSGTATNFGSATALTFTAGVAAVAASKNGLLKVYKSGPAEITATEGTLNTPEPLAITVAAGTAAKYTLAAFTNTPAAGAADDLTITAVDTYGNAATAYTGPHELVFSTASAGPNGDLPTVSNAAGEDIAFGAATTIEFSAGVATANGALNGEMKLYKSGATSIKATEGALTNATALAITVAAGPAASLTLTASATTLAVAGSVNLTITAKDVYGNNATSYAGAKALTFTGASASPSGTAPTVANSAGTATAFGAATALTFTAGVAAVSSSKNGLMKLYRAGATSVAATDGTLTTNTVVFTVTIGAVSKLALTSVVASAGNVSATCLFTCPITLLGNSGTVSANVSATDAYGNTVSELGTGHTVKVTATTGGTITEGALTIAPTGPAVSATRFTYLAPATGAFTHTITAAVSAGTVYTSATSAVSR